MKKKDFSDNKNKNIAELKKMVATLTGENLEKKMQNSQTKIKNVHLQRSLKKNIAQINTLIRIKEIGKEQKEGEK
ncbi:50S ribosomal protein L29 [Candidatus Curtissbacteria bacterium]|nr:50S ribosomal protein L29 [Candidatus Curtissbacteria bacterium]